MPSMLPTCPRCRQPVGEFPACPTCGLTLELLDAVYGSAEVVLEKVTDSLGGLGSDDRRLLEEEISAFEGAFPQILMAVHLVSLGSVPELRPFGFWLLNRAALAGGDLMRPNENAVLLVIDPPARAAGLTLGYQLEPWLSEATLQRVVASGCRDFKRGRLASGSVRILRELAAVMRTSLVPQACKVIVAVLMVVRLSAAEAVDEHPASALGQAGTSLEDEEELAPILESNRQPLGLDPLVLPQWSDEELGALDAGRPVNLGGGLWTAERFPLQPAPPWPPAAPSPNPAAQGVLGWEMMSEYGASRGWCVDPQRTMDPGRRARLEAHLVAHARSAVHPVRLWVVAPGQSLSPVFDEAMMHNASFGRDQPGVLAVVSAADPVAARIVLPPPLAAHAAAWRARVVSRIDSLADAPNRIDQLVLWLSLEADLLPPAGAAADRLQWHAAPATVEPRSGASAPLPAWVWLAIGSVAAAAGAAGVRRIRRRRRQQAMVDSLPARWLESDRPARLGGPFSGGSGAVAEW